MDPYTFIRVLICYLFDIYMYVQTGDFEVGILRQFPFTSKLQRMSVIVKRQDTDQFTLFAKGSPEMIASLCDEKVKKIMFMSIWF